MKRLTTLLLISLFTLTHHCFAQKTLVDDMYGKDTSAAPPRTITNSRNFTVDNFVNGYIILPNDSLQYGYVRFNGNVAIFKDTLTLKVKRYGPRDIKGFVADVDTFRVFTDTIVIRDDQFYRPYYWPYNNNQLLLNTLFIRQMIYGNKVSLYKTIREYPDFNYGYGYRYRGGNGTITENAVYLRRKNQWGYTYVPASKRDFKRFMASYLADDPTLVRDIKAGHLTYDNIDEIVKRYNDTN